jgi:hypothetical protein
MRSPRPLGGDQARARYSPGPSSRDSLDGGFAIEDAANDSVYVGAPGVQPSPTANYSLQTATDIEQSAVAATRGRTVLLVADISDDGEAYLYVDPTVGVALRAPDATIAAPFTPSAATYLHWSDSWGWTSGDVRVGTTLADVTPAPSPVPEPAAWSLMLVGFAGLGGALRARAKALGAGAPFVSARRTKIGFRLGGRPSPRQE